MALVQLSHLDGLLDLLRERKKTLKAGLSEVIEHKGLQFRAMPDSRGDTGTTLTWFMDQADLVDKVVEALDAENIRASVLYRPDQPDYHVYAHWTDLIHQRFWTKARSPWSSAQRPIAYSPDMCPQTLSLLRRAVQINVDPFMDNANPVGSTAVEETIDGITRVLDIKETIHDQNSLFFRT